MASRDYWWRCRDCGREFEHFSPYVAYRYRAGRRVRILINESVQTHEDENTGHRCARRVAPGI
jgi:hypothetical protein